MRASTFLRKHGGVFLRLQSAPGTCKLDSLRNLVSSMAPAVQEARDLGEHRQEEQEQVLRPPPVQEGLDQDLARLLSDLQGAEQERVVSLLQDLQGAATPRPGVLSHFQEELTYHIASPLPQVGGTGVAGGDTLPRCGVWPTPSSWGT